jgi:hypothetical protein
MVEGSVPDEVIEIFDCHNPFNRTMTLGYTHPLTETSTWKLNGSKGRPALKADLTAMCEPIVQKTWNLDISQPYGPPFVSVPVVTCRAPRRTICTKGGPFLIRASSIVDVHTNCACV